MGDLNEVIESVGEHGTGVVTAAGALIVAKRLLGPSLDMAGRRLSEMAEKRLDNLVRTFAKAEVRDGADNWYPHPRTVARVLNDASLYDDDVMQTYVAGLISGSRNDDGSDDRPVYYLSLIDGLTATQLKTFHALYAAVAHLKVPADKMPWIYVSQEELVSNITRLNGGSEPSGNLGAVLYALDAQGLVTNASSTQVDDGSYPLGFMPTQLGALLYDWAFGFSDEDVRCFADRDRPDIGLPSLRFESASVHAH